MTEYHYDLFGVIVSLPHERRVLRPAPTGAAPQVHVRYGTVAQRLEAPVVERYLEDMHAHLAIAKDGAMLWTTSLARFDVRDGNSVTIERIDPDARLAPLMRFVIGHCLPAVLIQRGCVALHANAVVTPAGAVVIGGASGAGKSTLAAALMSRGHRLLADDVTIISTAADGSLWVASGYPVYRVCPDTLERIQLPAADIIPMGGPRGKFSVIAPQGAFVDSATPLHAIYLLETHERANVSVNALRSLEKISALRCVSYAPAGVADLQGMLARLAGVARRAAVYRVQRPHDHWTADELADRVEAGATRSCAAGVL